MLLMFWKPSLITVELTFDLFTATTGPKIAGTGRLPLEIEPVDFGGWPFASATAASAACDASEASGL